MQSYYHFPVFCKIYIAKWRVLIKNNRLFLIGHSLIFQSIINTKSRFQHSHKGNPYIAIVKGFVCRYSDIFDNVV